jgi:hypothetical protein
MDERVDRLESVVAILTDRVTDLERRLQAFEGGWAGAPGATHTEMVTEAADAFDRVPVQQWLALAGRIFLVLGGAYLLRALTDSGVLPAHTGVTLGLLYGAPWLALAARAGARGASLDAFCHALATALIGYPLVWEATIRFGVIGTDQSAALLGALTAAALVLAAVTHLQGLAWVVTGGALVSALTLAMATRDWHSYTLLAVALGIGTLWLAYLREWGVCWLAALGLNFMLLVAAGRAAASGTVDIPLMLLLLTFAGYVGSAAGRNLSRHRLTPFDIAQSATVTVLALGGSLLLLRGTPGTTIAGIVALGLGLLAYGGSFLVPQLRRDAITFFFWALFALVLASTGAAICCGAGLASGLYAVTAVALTLGARRHPSLTLTVHASAYAMMAAVASGLLGIATMALVRPPAMGWSLPDVPDGLALIALAVLVVTPVGRNVSTRGATIPRVIVVSTLLWISMGVSVLVAADAVGNPARMSPSALATLRTAVLVLATLVLAHVERYESGREAGWLMYPLLIVTGLKLVFFDLPLGTPQTLFAALALYGFALIAAPRMARAAAPPERRELARSA